MRHALIDKRIAGIIRWLERLKQSYSSGAMENALMDAECARADLEILRADVWKRISKEPCENKLLTSLMNISKIIFLSVIIVLLTEFHVSIEIPSKVAITFKPEEKNEIVLAEPIKIIYEEPKKLQTVTKVNKPAKNANNNTKLSATPANSSITEVPKSQPVKPQKKVAYEELFSLMQTGHKALKNESSVIKIR